MFSVFMILKAVQTLDANSRCVDEVLPLLKGPVKFCLQVGPTSSCNETWARARRNPIEANAWTITFTNRLDVWCSLIQFKLTNLKCLSLKTGHMPKNSGTSPHPWDVWLGFLG